MRSKLYIALLSIGMWLGACAYSPTVIIPNDNDLVCTLILWYVDEAGDTIILSYGYSDDPRCPPPGGTPPLPHLSLIIG